MSERRKNNLAFCLSRIHHHVAPHKAQLMMLGGDLNEEGVKHRFSMVECGIQQVERKLLEIRQAAERNDSAAVLRALDDEIQLPD